VIAADTSTWIAFFQGDTGPDVTLLERALSDRQLLMPPAVLVELLSDPKMPAETAESLADLPLIEPSSGFWLRAGALRASVLGKKRKARLGDALIAQSCIDAGVALVTRDLDFSPFASAAGLTLTLP
jgi:predicted nucleic acid-binding protein